MLAGVTILSSAQYACVENTIFHTISLTVYFYRVYFYYKLLKTVGANVVHLVNRMII